MTENSAKIFGDLTIFSIILNLDEDYFGLWLNGELCYVVNGYVLGKFKGGVSLRDAWSILLDIIQKKKNRINLEIYEMDYETIFSIINNAIYSDDFRIYNIIEEQKFASDFSVLIDVQSMLDWKIYCVSDGNMNKLVYKKHNCHKVHGVLIPDNLVEKTLNDTFLYLDFLYNSELSKNQKNIP
jgi:hypothetical protein